jgi:hypothetical protein
MEITLALSVDALVEAHPKAAGFLADHHVVCIVCGEPYWGSLGELMTSKGIENQAALVEELKDYLAAEEEA